MRAALPQVSIVAIKTVSALILGALFLAAPSVPGRAPFQLPDRQEKPENPPFRVPDNVAVHKDLVYSRTGNREVVADLYLPKTGAGPFPALIYVHGSGMPKGKSLGASKGTFRRQAALLAAKGFVGLSIDYRFRTETRFPGCIYDAKAAVRWLRANAKQYRIDPGRIGLVGTSWGGYVVSMVATTQHLPEFEGDGSNLGFSSRVQAVVALSSNPEPLGHGSGESERRAARGPGSFADFVGATYEDKPELWAKASPMTHVSEHCPPFLMLHGGEDTPVGYRQAQIFMKKLLAAGVHVEFLTAEGGRHEFYGAPPWFEPALKRMEEFLTKYLK